MNEELDQNNVSPAGAKSDTSEGSEAKNGPQAQDISFSPDGGASTEGVGPREDEMEKWKKEAEEMKDAWTRERAEFMNYKKRMANEQARLRTVAVAGFVKQLLPVIDNLDRVIGSESSDPAVKNFITGVDMIREEMLQVLDREKIRKYLPDAEAFDPGSMEAIALEEREDLTVDTVVEVYQAGFYQESENGEKQFLRPARVKVGKAILKLS